MTRFQTVFLLALLAAALASTVPAVAADSLAITGLPSAPVSANGTASEPIPFTVEVNMDMGSCAGGTSAEFTVTLVAELNGTGGANIGAEVDPSQKTITVGPTDTVQSGAQYTIPSKLTVHANGLTYPLNVTANVKATASAPSCIVPVTAGTFADATGSATVEFKPSSTAATTAAPDEPVPGLEVPLLALAIVAVAFVARRK